MKMNRPSVNFARSTYMLRNFARRVSLSPGPNAASRSRARGASTGAPAFWNSAYAASASPLPMATMCKPS